MNLRKLYYLMLIIPMLFIYTGCSDDDPVNPPETVNEAEVAVQYLEDNHDPIENFASMTKANVVDNDNTLGTDDYVIDIRSADAYAAGHIAGAVNVLSTEVLAHYEANNLQDKADGKVVIACYSGQTAGWVTGLMHTAGYTNVRDLKWGMCSWNPLTSGSWTGSNVNNSRAAQFVTTATAKAAEGEMPTLETGKTEGSEIIRERVEAVFAEGFGDAIVSSDDVYSNLSDYYIVNYWIEDHYNLGHIDGAIQYTPKPGSELAFDKALKTLPTDKKIAVYCYTGQTSAHVAAYLRVLGYDAYTVLFGVNGMSRDNIPASGFNAETEIHDYELVQ
jgi:rhodanese-related sulfurtransferase